MREFVRAAGSVRSEWPWRRTGLASFAITLAASLAGCGQGTSSPATTDWELLGNSAEMQHHSNLSEINADTVKDLGIAWVADIPSVDGLVGNPLVKDGVIFQSGPRGFAVANDVRTGKQLWVAQPEVDYSSSSILNAWSAHVNRGLALYGKLTIQGHGCDLIALDQKTGREVWKTASCDKRESLGITGAPRVGGDMVFVGNGCGDSGEARGFVDAFDAATGKHRWRFYTMPGDPAKPFENEIYARAAKSWGEGWYEKTRGCAAPWDAINYDPETGLVIFGTGSVTPGNPIHRGKNAGDELFSNSVVAVNAKTGEYVWHFKQVPNDAWNYEAAVGIMLATLPLDGKPRRVVINVPKNGFVYLLDAKTGKFLSGKAFTPVNWTTGLDAKGRPVVPEEAKYWLHPGERRPANPSGFGVHAWEAIALDPKTSTLYIPAQILGKNVEEEGDGARRDAQDDGKPHGELIAWDLLKQKVVWRQSHRLPINSGILHSGGLVYQGTADGFFEIFDARSGKKLWSRQLGGAMRGAPSTVMAGGEQYIIVPVGNGSASNTGNYLALYSGTPETRSAARLVALKLGGTAAAPALTAAPPVPKPPVARFPAGLAHAGEEAWHAYGCIGCHGQDVISGRGGIPDLRMAPPPDYETFRKIVVEGALASRGMPKFDMVPDGDARALYAYVIATAWKDHEAGKSKAAEPRATRR